MEFLSFSLTFNFTATYKMDRRRAGYVCIWAIIRTQQRLIAYIFHTITHCDPVNWPSNCLKENWKVEDRKKYIKEHEKSMSPEHHEIFEN